MRRERTRRALIEAMAVGLPCIATPVGGIPELLRGEDLVPVDRPVILAAKIREFAEAKKRRMEASQVNHERARRFHRQHSAECP